MIVFSNCKINIGLNIVSKRDDGYHNIETVFHPLPIYDVLELLDADETCLTLKGIPIPGNKEENIVLKAYHLLKKDFPALPPVHFYLLKNIPPGAGLGAGSANAAFTLTALNKKFHLHLSTTQLINYALLLGSDCPFFIINQPCLASGRGEIIHSVPEFLTDFKIAVINPGIHISTPWAFQQITPGASKVSLKQMIEKPLGEWKETITNDFEIPVFKTYPEIEAIKNKLYDEGALFAAMSGSGSTVYGLFAADAKPQLDFPGHYFIKSIMPKESYYSIP